MSIIQNTNLIPPSPQIDVNSLHPFTRFCCSIGAIPASYLVSLTYEEQLLWLCNYLENTVIPTVNNNGEAVAELQGLYTQLKNYVDNYFANLDVQQEINNKLDEMAEDGTLDNIINQQIFSQINQDISNLKNTVNILTLPKKYLLVGDSYGEGYTPDGTIESWCIKFKNQLNLSDDKCIIKARGGYGFARPNYKFYDLINEVNSDSNITDVIILGGYNDSDYTFSEINSGVSSCKNLINQKFPNAKISIGMVGWCNLSDRLIGLFSTIQNYKISATNNSITYIDNIEYSLHDYFNYFSSDNIHPNENGQSFIASNLINYVVNNNVNVYKNYINCNITLSDDYVSQDISTLITQSLINNIVSFSIKNNIILPANNITIKGDSTDYLLGTFTNSYIIGNLQRTVIIPTIIIIKTNNLYYEANAFLKIYNKNLYFSFIKLNEYNTNFQTYENVTQLQICPCSSNIITNIN